MVHWHGIGRKLYILTDVKIVDGFDQADAADLEQIINVLLAACKALDNAEHQPEIAFDILFPGVLVSLLDPLKQRILFLAAQQGQLGSVDSADFHFIARHGPYLPTKLCITK